MLSIICTTICLQFSPYLAPFHTLGLFLLISSRISQTRFYTLKIKAEIGLQSNPCTSQSEMPLWPGVWGSLKAPRSSGVNGEKSYILSFSWHLISVYKRYTNARIQTLECSWKKVSLNIEKKLGIVAPRNWRFSLKTNPFIVPGHKVWTKKEMQWG